MTIHSFRFALLAGASLLCFPAFAAEDNTELPQVIVSANRTEMPVNQIASSVTVISRAEIERKNAQTVLDMLREVPGLSIAQNGGVGQTASLFMRGTNSNHVMVMVDGMWVNDPSTPTGAVDFSNLPNENIERIEIMRGPQSALYGSSAVGGVINIITRRGQGKPQYNAFAEYGRYNTRRGGLSTNGEVGRTAYAMSVSQLRTTGISAIAPRFGGVETDSNDTRGFSGNFSTRVTDHFTAKINSRYSRVNTEFDNFSSDSRVPSNITSQHNLRAAGELKLYDGKWTQELGISQFNSNRVIVGGFSGFQDIDANREMIDWVHHLRMVPNHVMTFGVEHWGEEFKSRVLTKREVHNTAAYADDQIELSDAAFVGVSGRVDLNQAYGHAYTYKIAPGYRILSTDTLLRASYGTAFKAPSLVQLFDPTSGNRNLNPEHSRGFDFGFEQAVQGDKASFGSTFFRNDIRQLFGFISTAPFTTINEQSARTQGVESFITLHPVDSFNFKITHTYTQSDNTSTDRELVRRPRHQVDASATYYVRPEWDVGANLYFSGARRDFNFSGATVNVDKFYRLDLVSNYRLTPTYSVYGRLDNALDARYEETFGFARPRRALMVGAKAKF
ncbi:MAG: TonB-dependent receptor [Proteobacteria bacterium]|nr:TonB-dependent receptor [Pseudomonadota bacterium]